MPLTKIFIGSSLAAKSQAKAIVKAFAAPTLKFLPWWEAFTAGHTLLEQLDSIKAQVDGSILVFSPESETTIRGRQYMIPSLNVMFEFGFFYSHLGKEKVAMIKYGEFYLPSDLGGYIHIFGSKGFRRGAVNKVGRRTTSEFDRWISQM